MALFVAFIYTRRGVTPHPALRSPDFPLCRHSGCLAVSSVILRSRRRAKEARVIVEGAALALGRAFTRLIVEDIAGSLAEESGRAAVRAAIEAAVDQVMWVSFVVIAVAVLVAGVAMWLDRRRPRPEGALPPPPRTIGDRVRELV